MNSAAKQPNLLIIVADQMAARSLPAWGNRVAKTPHIDRLCAEGVRFDRAYTNSPLCSPARATFMTGLLPSRTGVFDNACALPVDIPTFAHHLRLAGYRTILAGKMHFVGPDQLHGFEERITTDIYPADFGWTPDWTRPDERPDWYHSMDSVLQAGPVARTNQIDFDEEVMFHARRKLFDLARFGDGRPFCMVVSLTHPHDPFNIGQEFWDRFSDAEIDMPRISRRNDADPHTLRLRHACAIDAQPVTDKQVRDARHAYYGAVSFVDDQVGSLRATLATTGLDRDTVLVAMSDHGEMLGERGLWYKMSFFEDACRVPLIFHAPGRFTSSVVREVVSVADMTATFCELAGAPPPAGTDGRSLLGHLTGDGGHDEAFGEYCGEGTVEPIVMIRRGPWKFVHAPGDPDQLFNLDADPDELFSVSDTDALRAEAAVRWNLTALKTEVLASQARRRIVAASLAVGRHTAWDWQPPGEAATAYVRRHKPLERLEADARLASRSPSA